MTLSKYRIHWLQSFPFFLLHAAALVGSVYVGFQWEWLGLAVLSYGIRMFGVTAGFHRYFSHRSFKTSRVMQFLLALLAQSSVQKGALWWAAHHRHHHRHSDTEQDLHSPVQDGFWWSHVGWILSIDHNETRWELIRDLKSFPELVFLNRYPHLPVVALAIALWLAGGLPYFVWGFLVSTVMLWHGTFTINSLSHVFGTKRYATSDASRNNWLLALITLGEGWHNNHHAYMNSARQGFFWWEVDITYMCLKMMERLGLIHNLIDPPLAKLRDLEIPQNWNSELNLAK